MVVTEALLAKRDVVELLPDRIAISHPELCTRSAKGVLVLRARPVVSSRAGRGVSGAATVSGSPARC